MVHELTKEIASSDRIDFLISFIRFSGLQLFLPALRLFTARNGQNKSDQLFMVDRLWLGHYSF